MTTRNPLPNTSFICEIDFGQFGEYSFEVQGTFIAEVKGRDYLKNGDPGYPSEPSDFEVERITMCEPDKAKDPDMHYWWSKRRTADYSFMVTPELDRWLLDIAREQNS